MAGLADAAVLVIALDARRYAVRGPGTARRRGADHRGAGCSGRKDADAKTNEITQVRPLLQDMAITGH
jgi:hypothetical protein